MKFQIGAMSVGDILDRGLKLLLARLPTFFVILLIVQLPILLFQLFIPVLMEEQAAIAALVTVLGVLVLTAILTPIGTAAILHVIAQAFADRRAGIGEAFQVGLARFGPLLLASIAVGLIVGVGFALCIVPGLIFLSWYGLVSQVIVVENLGAGDAMARSKSLSEGYRWRVLGIYVLMIFIQFALGIGLGIVLATLIPAQEIVRTQQGLITKFNLMNQSIHVVLTFLLNVLVGTYLSVCTTLLYFDLRIRKEGYDLELAAKPQGVTLS